MSTKSILTALMNGNWGDITSPTRVPLKDRQVGSAIIDELYPTEYHEQTLFLLTDLTTQSGSVSYNLYFCKQGKEVHVSGTIVNPSATILEGGQIFTFNLPSFLPLGSGLKNYTQLFKNDGVNFEWSVSGNGGLRNTSAIPPSTTIYIDTTFITAN